MTETKELVYGGAKSGGKSDLGCMWILQNCIQYLGTRWIIGREELTKLKKSTFDSFFLVCKRWGVTEKFYIYNQSLNIITFTRGSQIYLLDLAYSPSSPEYQHLGGIQVSGIFVDEASEIDEKCKNIFTTLIRYKLEGIDKDGNPYKLLPRILYTCNPIKNPFSL